MAYDRFGVLARPTVVLDTAGTVTTTYSAAGRTVVTADLSETRPWETRTDRFDAHGDLHSTAFA